MKYVTLTLVALLALATAGSWAVADTVLVSEDFESYADTAAMNAVWSFTTTNGNLVDETYSTIIDDTFEPIDIGARAFPDGPGKAAEHVGSGFLEYQLPLNGGSPLVPTPSQSIVLQGDIFDVGAFGNKRRSIGLRSNAPANLVEIGHWNSNPVEFSARTILFAEPSPSSAQPDWQPYELPVELDRDDDADDITTLSDIGEAWHTHRATITPTTVTYEIDLFRDGIDARTGEAGFDAELTFEVVPTTDGFDSLRIGGPSGVSSLGNGTYGGVFFDNISLTLVDTEVGLAGDYNGDGTVDAADYTIWGDTLGSTEDLRADGNGNNAIDPGDLTVWADNYGATAPVSATAIPEPTTLLLVAFGLLGVARRR